MNERYHLLESTLVSADAVTATSDIQPKPQPIDIPGWRILDEDWKPCPIGVFYSHNHNKSPSNFGT